MALWPRRAVKKLTVMKNTTGAGYPGLSYLVNLKNIQAQPSNLAIDAVRKVTRKAVPSVMTTLNVAHL